VISGHGTIETAVAAIRKGAYDFVEKPFTADRLLLVVQRALEATRLKRENTALRVRSGLGDDLIGSSAAMAALRAAIERVAQTNSRVLIAGPAGSGKELIARLLHERSGRGGGQFVAINAASIAPDRMESEIFGEEGPDGRPKKIARCSLMKSATCRWRHNRRFCACWLNSASAASAAPTTCK
jgi:two-component system nitrogen regulation response regulator NtrX